MLKTHPVFIVTIMLLAVLSGCAVKKTPISSENVVVKKQLNSHSSVVQKQLNASEIEQLYADKTAYFPEEIEYTKADGVTFYKKKDNEIVLGKWFTKNDKICYLYTYSEKTFCKKIFKKGESVIHGKRVITLKTGDTENLQEAHHLKEESIFKAAQNTNTISAYDDFIKKYPNSIHVEAAKLLIAEATFNQAKTTHTIAAYDNFIKKYPNSKHVETAKLLITEATFNQAKTTHTIAAYDDFIKKYPNSKHVAQVHLWIESIIFEQAKYTDTVAAYDAFLQKYPKSEYATEARRNRQIDANAIHLNKQCATDSRLYITKIVNRDDTTIIHLIRGNSKNFRVHVYPPGHDMAFYIKDAYSDKKYFLLDTKGIAIAPTRNYLKKGEDLRFQLIFENIPLKRFHLIEGKTDSDDILWHFTNIQLKR